MSKIGLKYDKNVLKATSINVGRLEGYHSIRKQGFDKRRMISIYSSQFQFFILDLGFQIFISIDELCLFRCSRGVGIGVEGV